MKKILLIFPIVALIAVGCNSSQKIDNQTHTATPTPVQTANWQTYTSVTYGFKIKLPNNYQFDEPLVSDSTGAFVLPEESKQFNDTVKSPTASLAMSVIEFNKIPKTGQAACDKAQAEEGQSYDSNGKRIPFTCNTQIVLSQSTLSAFAQTIANSKINQAIVLPAFLASGASNGTVVDLNGSNGVLVLARNTQAVDSTASVYWFDKSSNLINLNQELAASTVSEATQTQQYKNFLTIISNFKFNQ